MENNPNSETLLARWLSGDLTEEERQSLADDKSLDALKIVTDNIASWKLPPMDLGKGFERLKDEQQHETKETKVVELKPQPLTYAMRIAAAVTLLLIGYVGWQFYFNDIQEYQTGIAGRLDVTLPDQSIAMMDAGSFLTYDESTWDDERKLTLKGQAYFDVVKGSTFTVETDQGSVTVLGTEFNVRHFDDRFSVTCYEGSVRVESGNETVVLAPSEGVSFEGGIMDTYETNDPKPDWQLGYTQFSGTILVKVVAELARRFEAEINLPEKYHGLKYSGAVPITSLEEALQAVFVPMELEYEIMSDGNVRIY